jgi:hypothetical protein
MVLLILNPPDMHLFRFILYAIQLTTNQHIYLKGSTKIHAISQTANQSLLICKIKINRL